MGWLCCGVTVGRNDTNKLSNRGSGRPAADVFCQVKLLFLSKESGGFEDDNVTAVSS